MLQLAGDRLGEVCGQPVLAVSARLRRWPYNQFQKMHGLEALWQVMRALLPVLLIGSLPALSACAVSPAERMTQAREEFARQNYQAARQQLDAALRDDPANREALAMLVQTLLRSGDGEGATWAIERLQQAGASAAELVVPQAEAQLLRGQAETALRLLGASNSSDSWRVRAAAALLLGREGEALDAFRRGLALGADTRLAAEYARFLLRVGERDEAARQIARLRQVRPKAIETLMLKGGLAEAEGNTALALQLYREAGARYAWLAAPVVAEANLLDLQGRLDDAARLAVVAAERQPEDPAVLDLQLSIYAQQGKWDLIRQLLQRRELLLDPASATGLIYAEALLRLGHSEHARAWLRKAVIIDPHNRYAHMMLAEAQLATGDPRAALRTLRPLIVGTFVYPREYELAEQAAQAARDPLAARLQADRASGARQQREELLRQGLAATAQADWAAALLAWQQLQVFGEDAELLRRIADCASMVGQHDLARTSADKALALQPLDAGLLYLAGRVRLQAKAELDRAVALLERAVSEAPANPQFRADLARARQLAASGAAVARRLP